MSPEASPPPLRVAHRLGGLTVVVLLLIAAIPLTNGLRQADTLSSRELTAVLTSEATWKRQAVMAGDGLTLNRLVPMLNGRAVIDRPPGLTWLQVLAILPPDRADARTQGATMLFRSRLISVGCALTALGAVFWAGTQLGGLGTATLAGLVFLANPVWLIYGRSATAEAPTAAFALLAAAVALWAMRPLRPAAKLRRQLLGYTLCGLLLGASALVGGPAVAAAVLLPLMIMSLLCPRRTGHLLGLTAAGALALLLTVPWVLHGYQSAAQTSGGLRGLIGATWPSAAADPARALQLVSHRAFALVVSGGVWSMVIAAAALAPWVIEGPHARRRATMTWTWGALATVLALLGPAWLNADGQGWAAGVLLATPALALVAAQLLAYAASRAQLGRTARAWQLIRWPTAIGVTAASVGLPCLWIMRDPSTGLSTPLLSGALLLAAAVLGLRAARSASPTPATCVWALWTVTLTTLLSTPPHRQTWTGPLLGNDPVLGVVRLEEQRRDLGPPATPPPRRAALPPAPPTAPSPTSPPAPTRATAGG